MGRPLGFDREEALDAAVVVFWERGWSGSSTRALGEAMDLGASSLYATFGSKAELFELALRRYVRRFGPSGADAEAVRTWVRRVVSDRAPTGCLLVASALERDLLPDEGKLAVDRALEQLDAWLVGCLGDAERAPRLRTVVLGLHVQHRAGVDRARLRAEAERWLSELVPCTSATDE